MNIYHASMGSDRLPDWYIAADSFAAASAAAGPDIVSIELLGELTFANDVEPVPTGGRKLTTAEIKATFTPDGEYLISLEDGKKYKSLRRHLAVRNMTPAQYRAKWGLPDAYPTTSVAYSMRRSELAKSGGLGKRK